MDDDLFEFVEPARAMSPCVNICEIDGATGWCLGCGRTMDEIASWSAADDADRRLVLDRLPQRMTALRTRTP